MESNEKLLQGYSDIEKGAYLGAIASLATADHVATEDENEFITELANNADLSDHQRSAVLQAAKELTGDELKRCLDVLKTSELRYSLMADLIAFAQADGKYTEDEKQNVEKIAQYLGINQQQFSLLDQFVNKTAQAAPTPEQATKPGFLESLGLGDRFKSAGMNINGLTKGLLGIVGPMLLARMLTGGMQRRARVPGAGLGMPGGMGGFGSLIGALSGGRGYRGLGDMRPRLFGF
jgi:uncharacterized tellurite resistance protein B-like protein